MCRRTRFFPVGVVVDTAAIELLYLILATKKNHKTYISLDVVPQLIYFSIIRVFLHRFVQRILDQFVGLVLQHQATDAHHHL